MKVLFFIHSLGGGGAERVTTLLAAHWVAKGWVVTVVTLTPPNEDMFLLPAGTKRIVLPVVGDSTGITGGLVNNARRILSLRSVLRSVRPDVAVAMMNTANVLLALAAIGVRGVAVVGSERVHPPHVPLKWPWEWLRSSCYRWLDALVVLSIDSGVWARTHTSARHVVVIPNPVSHLSRSLAPELSPRAIGDHARRRLLAVGRLEYQKGFDVLISAFASLVSTFPQWELAIVGEGPARAELQAQIDRLGIGEAVLLPGRVGNLGEWYRHAGMFVLSSRFEGFPNSLVEAMAHGLAVVGIDCETGPRDIIRDDVDGILVPAGDTGALRAALARLMGDDGLRARLGSRAVEVRERFALERVSGMWERLFGEVCA